MKNNNYTEYVEYRMPRKMFNMILKTRDNSAKKSNPYAYVMEVVNSEFGLKGKVRKIIIEG